MVCPPSPPLGGGVRVVASVEHSLWLVFHEFSSSSSGVVVPRAVCRVVGRHDVACHCDSDCGSSDSGSSDVITRDDDEICFEPMYLSRVRFPKLRRKVQLRDAGFYDSGDDLLSVAFVAKRSECSVSLIARPPSNDLSISIDSAHSNLSDDSFVKGHFDRELLRWYHPHVNKRGVCVTADHPMYNKWPGGRLRSRRKHSTVWDVTFLARLRNIKVDLPAFRGRWQIGHVVRYRACTYVHNLEGRRTGVPKVVMRVENGHHVGQNHLYYGVPLLLPSHVRIVYIDVRKLKRCSPDSVSFHSSAYPTFDVRAAKSIARTLWTTIAIGQMC